MGGSLVQKTCSACGKLSTVSKGKDRLGRKIYRSVCRGCHTRPWTKYKANICEECGFIPIHPSQLEMHHIDGNGKNHESSNLMTLCANCHRLVHRGG